MSSPRRLAAPADALALQPYRDSDEDDADAQDLPISEALRRAARAAAAEARKPGRERRQRSEYVSLDLLIPADYNPRRISDAQLTKLRESLSEYGQVQEIVVNTYPGREGVIVGGHQRLKAMRLEDFDEAEVKWVHVPLEREKVLNLALNRISGDWDPAMLAQVIHDLAEDDEAEDLLGATGFEDDEVTKLLDAWDEANGAGDPDDPDEDEIVLPDADHTRTQAGQLWRLGRHKLYVGDSRAWESWVTLMGDELADACWTDPPYGVNYVGKTKKKLTIQNDGADDLPALLGAAFACIDKALKPGSPVYVCEPAGRQSLDFRCAFRDAGWRFHETLVWVKDSMVLGHSDYHVKHETILYGYTQGQGRRGRGGTGWYGDDAQTTIFEVKRPKASREHPTMKPVALITAMVQNSVPYRGVVADCFGGSGSTLLACEETARQARLIELSPQFADVILGRWEALAGGQAELVAWPAMEGHPLAERAARARNAAAASGRGRATEIRDETPALPAPEGQEGAEEAEYREVEG